MNKYQIFNEWKRNHAYDPRFEMVDAKMFKGYPMVLFYCEGDVKPWSVQYAGNGHYYETKEEVLMAMEFRTKKGRWPESKR